jgi:hypothetical protein
MRNLFLLSLFLVAVLASPAVAHELGTVQVSASFAQDGTWRVDVAIDEEHVPKVAVSRPGETRYGAIAGLTPELRGRLGAFLSALADRSSLAFDRRKAAPEKLSVDRPAPPADDPFAPPPKVTLHLAGTIPAGARAATFSTAIPLGHYPVAFWNEGDTAPSRRWQQGGEGGGPPFPLSPRVVPPGRGRVALRYLELGFTQVLPRGMGILLFTLGIFLLGLGGKPLLVQLAALTAGETVALVAATQGLVALPPGLLAAAIALSIAGVAIDNLLSRRLRPSRVVLVFVGGVLHGLGFAGTLRTLGLPATASTTALLGFDLGIIAAQLAVIATAVLLVGLPFRRESWYRHRVVIPASLVLATLGLYSTLARLP